MGDDVSSLTQFLVLGVVSHRGHVKNTRHCRGLSSINKKIGRLTTRLKVCHSRLPSSLIFSCVTPWSK